MSNLFGVRKVTTVGQMRMQAMSVGRCVVVQTQAHVYLVLSLTVPQLVKVANLVSLHVEIRFIGVETQGDVLIIFTQIN